MNPIINTLLKLGIRKDDLDHHFIRASMVIIFLFFGYQKWFECEAPASIPYISHGPLIFWMYPVFGLRGASWFLGVAEWTFGALGPCFTFIATVTIIPFIPNGWAASAGGLPALTETVAFLLKDLVLLAVFVYLLRQDGVSIASEHSSRPASTPFQPDMSSLGVTRGQ